MLLWVMVWAPTVPARAAPCPSLDAEVESVARAGGDILLRIAPWLGGRGAAALLARADQGDAQAIMALGLTGQAEALRVLREHRFAKGTSVARALALLALGDGTETATIAHALEVGDPGQRARIVVYLGALRTVRSRDLLEKALSDPDAAVRLEAARPLAKARHPRARRVLLEIARTGAEPLRAAATLAASTAPPPKLEDQMDDDDDDAPDKPTPGKDAGAAPVAISVLEAARARLKGPDGDALRAALQLFGQNAPRTEVDVLLGVAHRGDVSLDTRGLALETALRLCPP